MKKKIKSILIFCLELFLGIVTSSALIAGGGAMVYLFVHDIWLSMILFMGIWGLLMCLLIWLLESK